MRNLLVLLTLVSTACLPEETEETGTTTTTTTVVTTPTTTEPTTTVPTTPTTPTTTPTTTAPTTLTTPTTTPPDTAVALALDEVVSGGDGPQGCGDMLVYQGVSGGTAVLHVNINDDLALDAATNGTLQEGEYDVADGNVGGGLIWGNGLSDYLCNDVPFSEIIDGDASLISGTLVVSVTSDATYVEPWSHIAYATVTLEDAVFEDNATGEQVELSTWTVEDVLVGWYPG